MRVSRVLQTSMLCAAAALAIGTGSAMAGPDCPPLGHMPTYPPGEAGAETRDYDAIEFIVQKGDDTETVKIAGRTCKQSYFPKDGTDPASDLEIQSNYRDQLKKLGAAILFADDRNTVARLDRNGQETWAKVYSQETEIDVAVVVKQPLKQVLTKPSGNDYRLVGHMPNYVAQAPEKRNFDQLSFKVQDGDDTRDVKVQGARYAVSYFPKDGATPSSDLEIQGNYAAALQAAGATILFADDRNTVARLDDKGQAVWIHVYSQESEIDLQVIEEKPFQASLQAPQANALKTALDREGRVALYVNFDFAKASLKPDAAPIVAQVVKLLKDDPSLKLSVEGQTDNVGTHDANLKLSEQRAAAVTSAIVSAGISRDRVQSAGYGPDKPVADNETGEGRAKNRRVELVKR